MFGLLFHIVQAKLIAAFWLDGFGDGLPFFDLPGFAANTSLKSSTQ